MAETHSPNNSKKEAFVVIDFTFLWMKEELTYLVKSKIKDLALPNFLEVWWPTSLAFFSEYDSA